MKKSEKGKVKMNIKIDINVKNNPQNPRLVSKKKKKRSILSVIYTLNQTFYFSLEMPKNFYQIQKTGKRKSKQFQRMFQ